MSTPVLLTKKELEFAKNVGLDRHQYAKAHGFKDRHGIPASKAMEYDIVGAKGEYILCKYLGVEWDFESNLRGGHDVEGYEVKSSSQHHLSLLLRPDSGDDFMFVQITVVGGIGRIHGWLYGREAKQPQWLKAPNNRPPAYFVPSSSLHALFTLPGIERYNICRKDA